MTKTRQTISVPLSAFIKLTSAKHLAGCKARVARCVCPSCNGSINEREPRRWVACISNLIGTQVTLARNPEPYTDPSVPDVRFRCAITRRVVNGSGYTHNTFYDSELALEIPIE